jgi:hypothetical protein
VTDDGAGDRLPAPPHLVRREPSTDKQPWLAPEEATEPRLSRRPTTDEPWSLDVVGQAGTEVHVGRRGLIVGQQMGGLLITEPFIAEGHASFSLRGADLVVEDGGSASGVFVSLPPVVVLEPGHVIAVGRQMLRYVGELTRAAPLPGRLAFEAAPLEYGAPLPPRAFRVEHVLVGERSGQAALFRTRFTLGRTEGTWRFPDDEQLDPLHVELRPGDDGIELVTHSRRWPSFVRLAPGTEAPLFHGALVRLGTVMVRVISNRPAAEP